MSRFVDTSALYALCDADNASNRAARRYARDELAADEHVTHRYVEVETLALVQSRLGVAALRALVDDILPTVRVERVDDSVHAEALAELLASPSRAVSFVDRVSFSFMRRHRITTAFAFDRDFAGAGFDTLPRSQ